jgi:hypothetical protein
MEREIVIGRSERSRHGPRRGHGLAQARARSRRRAGRSSSRTSASTNGTFVNGEKVKKMRLKEGDRILIGTSIIKLVAMDPTAAPARPRRARGSSRTRARRSRRQRRPADVGLGRGDPAARPAAAAVDVEEERRAHRRARRGIGPDLPAQGADLLRVDRRQLRGHAAEGDLPAPHLDDGSFELEPPDERQVIEEITESTEALLMEGMRQLDEMRQIDIDLPALNQHLRRATPLAGRLRDLGSRGARHLPGRPRPRHRPGGARSVRRQRPRRLPQLAELLKREFVVVT